MAKQKIINRAQPLTSSQQQQFLKVHIPDRIRIIEICLGCQKLKFGRLAAPAIFSRAIASFLGFNTKAGKLVEGHDYFAHETGKSWEVKLSDIAGGKCIKISDLTNEEKKALEDGINETNTAFAHLTFWEHPTDQDAAGSPTRDYLQLQQQTIRKFADVVIRLFRRSAEPLLENICSRH